MPIDMGTAVIASTGIIGAVAVVSKFANKSGYTKQEVCNVKHKALDQRLVTIENTTTRIEEKIDKIITKNL